MSVVKQHIRRLKLQDTVSTQRENGTACCLCQIKRSTADYAGHRTHMPISTRQRLFASVFFGVLCDVSFSTGETRDFQVVLSGLKCGAKTRAMQVLAAVSSGFCSCHSRGSEGLSRGFCRSDSKACYCYSRRTVCCLCLQRVYLVPASPQPGL